MNDMLRVSAALARSKDEFCIAIRAVDAEPAHSFVLIYDGSLLQPWSRVDVRRVIVAVADRVRAAPGCFAVVSDEGDVYVLQPGQPVMEKIRGTGVYSPDAVGRGYIACLSEIDGVLYAGGSTAQLYRRDGPGSWTDIGGSAVPAEAGFEDLGLAFVAGAGASEMYAGGSITVVRRRISDAEQQQAEDAAAAGDIERMIQILDATMQEGVDYTDQGRAYVRSGDVWRRIDLPTNDTLRNILVETPDKVWMVGFGGAILRGNATAGFQKVGFHGDKETILSFAKFGDRYVAASDHALHWFNGHNLSPLRPTTLTRVATPLRVQAIDDVLFYFDYNQGVHRFDGKVWEEIPIPPELLERSFAGLPKP